MQIQVLESTAVQQEEYARRNLENLTKSHTEHLQIILKRNEETEKAFLVNKNKRKTIKNLLHFN